MGNVKKPKVREPYKNIGIKSILLQLIFTFIFVFGAACLAISIFVSQRYDAAKDNIVKNANVQYSTAMSDYSSQLRRLGIPSTAQAKITIETDMIYNHGIGNDWSSTFKINNKLVDDGDSINFNLTEGNLVESKFVENDPSSDDVGTSSDIIFFDLNNLKQSFMITHNTEVKEHYGKGAGESALFKTTYRIELINYSSIKAKLDSISLPSPPFKLDENTVNVTYFTLLRYDTFSLCVSIFVFLVAIGFFITRFDKMKRKEYELQQKRKVAEEKRVKEEQRRQYYTDLLADTPIEDALNLPTNIIVTPEGKPIDTSSTNGRYGALTVYTTSSGTRYHKRRGCSSAYNETMLYDAVERKFLPCANCTKTKASIPEWYPKLQEAITITKKHNIKFFNR